MEQGQVKLVKLVKESILWIVWMSLKSEHDITNSKKWMKNYPKYGTKCEIKQKNKTLDETNENGSVLYRDKEQQRRSKTKK